MKNKKLFGIVSAIILCIALVLVYMTQVRLPKEPEDIYTTANKQMKKLESYEINGMLQTAGMLNGDKADTEIPFRIIYSRKPLKLKIELNNETLMYFMQDGQADTYFTVYINIEDV